MRTVISIMMGSTMLLGVMGSHASAEDELIVEDGGLIEQTINLEGRLSMEQRYAVGSIQAANLVGAGDKVRIKGTVRQSVSAESIEMNQRYTAGSTQAINAVTAGNPAASGFGF